MSSFFSFCFFALSCVGKSVLRARLGGQSCLLGSLVAFVWFLFP
uniref:Uncharacterized protein n=1 Tax=Anguilla anguilla TaxID=7936 RepID=A0A0E9W988_ANGAN